MTIGPGCLDEHPSDVSVTGLRDATGSLSLTAGIEGWDESHEPHEVPRSIEPCEISQFGNDPSQRFRTQANSSGKTRWNEKDQENPKANDVKPSELPRVSVPTEYWT